MDTNSSCSSSPPLKISKIESSVPSPNEFSEFQHKSAQKTAKSRTDFSIDSILRKESDNDSLENPIQRLEQSSNKDYCYSTEILPIRGNTRASFTNDPLSDQDEDDAEDFDDSISSPISLEESFMVESLEGRHENNTGSPLAGRATNDLIREMIHIPNDHVSSYSWLNCTRLNPPKLSRSKKRSGCKRYGRGPRIPFAPHQIAVLETTFSKSQYLSSDCIHSLADRLNLTETRVKIWFQNRRARFRREKEASLLAQAGNGCHNPFYEHDDRILEQSSVNLGARNVGEALSTPPVGSFEQLKNFGFIVKSSTSNSISPEDLSISNSASPSLTTYPCNIPIKRKLAVSKDEQYSSYPIQGFVFPRHFRNTSNPFIIESLSSTSASSNLPTGFNHNHKFKSIVTSSATSSSEYSSASRNGACVTPPSPSNCSNSSILQSVLQSPTSMASLFSLNSSMGAKTLMNSPIIIPNDINQTELRNYRLFPRFFKAQE